MSEIRRTICDNKHCHVVKQTEDHWWMLWIDGEGELHMRPMCDRPGEGVLTFCGEPCAMKKLSEFMSGARKLPRKNPLRHAWSAIEAAKGTDLLPEKERLNRLSSPPTQ